ncbi:MAG: arginine deiminase family protein [Acidobacteriota bacterium]
MSSMSLRVTSEIGTLRRVLVHRPGFEIDWMVPSLMERLLFDDILDGDEARDEHAAFRRILEAAGVETLDPETLLADCLATASVRDDLLARLHADDVLDDELATELAPLEPRALAATLINGVRQPTPGGEEVDHYYRLPPVPNYFFQRDPQSVIGTQVMISSMATDARLREPVLAETIFRHHPALRGAAPPIVFNSKMKGHRRPTIEGGDVLVPSPEVLLVGLSERTNRWGVEALVEHLRSSESTFRHVLVVELPPRRSCMHLDTVFTFVDHGVCLAYLPVIEATGSEAGHVYRIDLDAKSTSYNVRPGLVAALGEVGIDVELVACGGTDSVIDQQREQWTDGANAFAIAPGVIVIYRRNRRTVDQLAQRGWRVLGEEDVVEGSVPVLGHGPTVITLLGNELARARGGPRCMTMPLERLPLD